MQAFMPVTERAKLVYWCQKPVMRTVLEISKLKYNQTCFIFQSMSQAYFNNCHGIDVVVAKH